MSLRIWKNRLDPTNLTVRPRNYFWDIPCGLRHKVQKQKVCFYFLSSYSGLSARPMQQETKPDTN